MQEEQDRERTARAKILAHQQGWMSLLVAAKFVHVACHIVRETRPPQAKRALKDSSLVSGNLRKFDFKVKEKKEISAKMGGQVRPSFNHVLATIRWMFDQRRCVAVHLRMNLQA